MAEGGASPEERVEVPAFDETAEHVVLVDSLELLFARDFLTHVIRRKVPGWTFSLPYGTPCPCTPFSFKIRQAVDFYMTKHDIDMYYFMFRTAFGTQNLDYGGFMNAVNLVVQTTFSQMEESYQVMRLLCLYGTYTTRAVKHGIEKAPYYALRHIQSILSAFIERKNTIPDHFFGLLPFEVDDLNRKTGNINIFDKFGFHLLMD